MWSKRKQKNEQTQTTKFYKLTNVAAVAALLSLIPWGFKNAVLPEPLTKNHTVICLTPAEEKTRKLYNDNLCLFRALALHLHGIAGHEEES